MRERVLSVVLCMVVVFPTLGNAQVYQFRTPPPEVTAATAPWQINGEPVMFQGVPYYPTREFRMFDGQVMAQIGVYERVPVYTDTVLEPYSVIYVPVGRDRMRAYERLRDRELAGTTGSRVPSFPVAGPRAPMREEPVVGTAGPRTAWTGDSSAAAVAAPFVTVATPAAIMIAPVGGAPIPARPAPTRIESIPGPSGNRGIWLEFNGERWFTAGEAVSLSPDRFRPIGEYRGFPVYQDASGDPDRIWVPVVPDGPIAPYAKR